MLDVLRSVAAAQGGVFTPSDARRAGIDRSTARRLLRRGLWMQVRRGVYAETAFLQAATPAVRHAIATAAERLAAGVVGVASHDSAALIHGLPLVGLPWHWPWFGSGRKDAERVHLTVPPGHPRLRDHDTVHWYKAALPPGRVVRRHGVPVTSLARTVVDIARHRPFAEALVVADAALHSERCSLADLEEVLRTCAGWPGIRRAVRVVAAANGLAESPLESLVRVLADAGGLPTPKLQVPIYDDEGFIGRVDLFFPAQRTVGEADGRLKYDDPRALFEEKRREDRLRLTGLAIVRPVWDDTIWKPELVVARFQRGFRLGLRSA